MKNLFKSFVVLLAVMAAVPSFAQKANNTLTEKEKKQGWTLLFNGKDFTGWRQCNNTGMAPNWVIEDEAMKVFTAPGKKPGHGAGGDILYKEKKFKNFELSVDWKTSKMGNSGIFYYVREVPGKPIYYAAPEVQVLDNVDATDNKLANHLAGSLYDMLPADPKTVKPAGRMEHDRDQGEGWQSDAYPEWKGGRSVYFVEQRNGMIWLPIANSKISKASRKASHEGYIGLQDHGYPIWFRNIKIRELK